MSAIGTATLDFGTGSNEASVEVTGQASILATSKTDAFIMANDETSDHTASDHRYLACIAGITCGTPVAAHIKCDGYGQIKGETKWHLIQLFAAHSQVLE